jgi:hypothetical protein
MPTNTAIRIETVKATSRNLLRVDEILDGLLRHGDDTGVTLQISQFIIANAIRSVNPGSVARIFEATTQYPTGSLVESSKMRVLSVGPTVSMPVSSLLNSV